MTALRFFSALGDGEAFLGPALGVQPNTQRERRESIFWTP